MKQRMIPAVKEQRGAVLVISLLVMTVLLVQGLAFLAIANTEDTIASNFRNYTQAFYAAEAGLESGLVDLRDLLAANSNPLESQLAVLAAAVLADAITILSNNWGPNDSDTKGDQVTSNRPATNTTVNAAFALGPSAESDVGQGNGQLENVIRFLENWKGKTFTYNGSIIALWHSQQAIGSWRCCGNSGDNYYRPPNRNWAYDPLFNTTIPPGTPVGILVMRGRWAQG